MCSVDSNIVSDSCDDGSFDIVFAIQLFQSAENNRVMCNYKITPCTVTLLGLAAALTLPAQDFKITHGPWLCDMTEDGVTVLWTTNKPALS